MTHRRLRRRAAAAAIPLLAAGLLVAYGLAETGSWDASVGGPTGGGTRSGADQYVLEGVIGQPFTGTSSGGQFSLDAGMLGGAVKAILAELHLPMVVKAEPE